MTHDLRTPLNAINGFADILFRSEDCDAKTRKEFAAYIHESGQHLLSLVNQLLDMSKIEAGAMELEIDTVSVETLMRRATTVVQPIYQEKGVHLQVSCLPEDVEVDVDKQAIIRVFINLMSNAAKFTNKDKSVYFEARRAANGDILVAVRDEGRGMRPEDATRVLQPYIQAQVRDRNDGSGQGTGLGLPISKQLVELHGGRLRLDSQLDIGTTVTISIPAFRVLNASIADPVDPGA